MATEEPSGYALCTKLSMCFIWLINACRTQDYAGTLYTTTQKQRRCFGASSFSITTHRCRGITNEGRLLIELLFHLGRGYPNNICVNDAWRNFHSISLGRWVVRVYLWQTVCFRAGPCQYRLQCPSWSHCRSLCTAIRAFSTACLERISWNSKWSNRSFSTLRCYVCPVEPETGIEDDVLGLTCFMLGLSNTTFRTCLILKTKRTHTSA